MLVHGGTWESAAARAGGVFTNVATHCFMHANTGWYAGSILVDTPAAAAVFAQAFLSRLLLMLGSFVIMCLLLF